MGLCGFGWELGLGLFGIVLIGFVWFDDEGLDFWFIVYIFFIRREIYLRRLEKVIWEEIEER